MEVKEEEWTNHIIDTMVMNIYITNNVVEFDHLEKTFKEKLEIGRGVLTLGGPLLIRLMNISLQTWILKCNHITPPDQIIWIIIISVKVWYKQNNNNPDYKYAEAKQVPLDTYRATTWSITKRNESKWIFPDSWVWWYGSTH